MLPNLFKLIERNIPLAEAPINHPTKGLMMPLLPLSKRDIHHIVIHCSATPPYRNIGAADIDRWHKGRGWNGIGYNGVIRRNGVFEVGRHVDPKPAQAEGYNDHAIAICLIGGVGDDNMPTPNYTKAQWKRLDQVIAELETQYPNARVMGHRDFPNVAKACPCFDVEQYLLTGNVVP